MRDRPTVVAADGSVWEVGVVWLPRAPGLRRRWRRRRDAGDLANAFDLVDTPGDGVLTAIVVTIGLVLLAVVLVLFVVPAVLLVVEMLVVAVLVVAGVLGRVLLRRPWTVVARCTAGPAAGRQESRAVVGLGPSRALRDDWRRELARGSGWTLT